MSLVGSLDLSPTHNPSEMKTMADMNALFEPIKIGNRAASNRLVINAMECCDSDEHGDP
jgi:hypothetical protein